MNVWGGELGQIWGGQQKKREMSQAWALVGSATPLSPCPQSWPVTPLLPGSGLGSVGAAASLTRPGYRIHCGAEEPMVIRGGHPMLLPPGPAAPISLPLGFSGWAGDLLLTLLLRGPHEFLQRCLFLCSCCPFSARAKCSTAPWQQPLCGPWRPRCKQPTHALACPASTLPTQPCIACLHPLLALTCLSPAALGY